MPKVTETLYFTNREEWRAWLEKNHDSKSEVWLVYYKKGTGKPRIPYDDAVEEALCYGWIDSTVKRLDDERYVQRFTPRKPNSVWAESNLKRIRKLKKDGRMTKAGILTLKNIRKEKKVPRKIPVPSDLKAALQKNPKAKQNFEAFPESTKKIFSWWVMDSKKPETRERRIREVVRRSEKRIKAGILRKDEEKLAT